MAGQLSLLHGIGVKLLITVEEYAKLNLKQLNPEALN
jgi:hypothetical protein